jgi:hypothetical protein
MQKFLRLLGFTFCLATSPAFAEMLEAPVDDGEIDPLGVQFDVQGSYVGDGDVQRGSREINNFDEFNFAARLLILPRTKIGILRLGADYEIYAFDIPEGAQVPDRLQSVALIIGLDTKFSDSLLVRVEARPGFYFANDIAGKDFNVPFILGGTYLYNSTLQFVFGLGVDFEAEYPVLPGLGVRWKFAPQWVLNATVPTPRLEYEVNRNLTLYAGGELRSKNYRVGNNNVGDASEPGNLNSAILNYTEIRTGAGLNWRIGEACRLQIEGGYVPRRVFDYHRADIRYKSNGGAPYASISLNAVF